MRRVPPRDLHVHADIAEAETLPAWVYVSAEAYDRVRDQVFGPSWQLVADLSAVKVPGQVHPVTLLEGCLDEPLLLTRDAADRLHCLSNVCTHRGMLVCEAPDRASVLACRYHGRRFDLDGRFRSMPEFEMAKDFPRPEDDLPRVAFGMLGPFVFASLAPDVDLEELAGPVRDRLNGLSPASHGWAPLAQGGATSGGSGGDGALTDAGGGAAPDHASRRGELVYDASRSTEYLVRANWALYCDNYLEGFHIPYVHPTLNTALDYGSYTTELFPFGSLQLGVAKDDEECFDLTPDSPDHGLRVAAYYFWLFPNTMLNVYPWGISVNIVRPLGVDRTRVSFLTYVGDPERLDRGAGAGLDRVEREDEAVVEAVQRGLSGRLYHPGRYSPTREQGVHHFHGLLAKALTGEGGA